MAYWTIRRIFLTDPVKFFGESDNKNLLSRLVAILDGAQRFGRVLENSRKVVVQEVLKLVVTLRRGPLKTTEDDDSTVITFKRALDHELDKRLKKHDLRVCAAACCLDPRCIVRIANFLGQLQSSQLRIAGKPLMYFPFGNVQLSVLGMR